MNKIPTLNDFLEYKTLYYDKIDYTIIKKSWDCISLHIKLPFVIHIVGTNGKGSTGRFLSHHLNKSGYDTLHYSSPHILKFNERIWINGYDVSDTQLESAHKYLYKLLDDEYLKKLTYFEYTTLLALVLSTNRDYLVLEAGLGGEFDATNVVKNDLSVVTKIGFDHQAFLGNTIKEIAGTKLRSCDNVMLVSKQDYDDVYIEAKKYPQILLNEFDTKKLNFPLYLKSNLNTVISVLKYLGIKIELDFFKDLKLFGRCQKLSENVTVDVGHNSLAAKAIVEEFRGKKINLIYNSYEDKDYEKVLLVFKPIIETVYIIDIEDNRIVDRKKLESTLKSLDIDFCDYTNTHKDKEYLVFGSFKVVEKFLKENNLELGF